MEGQFLPITTDFTDIDKEAASELKIDGNESPSFQLFIQDHTVVVICNTAGCKALVLDSGLGPGMFFLGLFSATGLAKYPRGSQPSEVALKKIYFHE